MQSELGALRRRMAAAYGVSDADALTAVVRAGYSAATVDVLTTAPLLEIAWADGHVTDGERLSIIEVAVAMGIDGGPAYERLLDLLAKRPPRSFFENSRQALRGMLGALSPAERLVRWRPLLTACRRIASVSRSAMGRRISSEERRAIRRMSQELTPDDTARERPGSL